MEGVDYPATLSWNVRREHLTGTYLSQECARREQLEKDFPSDSKQNRGAKQPWTTAVSRDEQELALLEDLIYALKGMEGSGVKAKPIPGKEQLVEFFCENQGDAALLELARRIFPLCGDHYRVQQFVENRLQYPQGLISHALSASLRRLLLEYEASVTQMDDELRMGQLSLAGMWFQCQPLQGTFRVLAALVKEAELKQLSGAPLLNLLSQEAILQGGDQVHQTMLQKLWKSSCLPYMRMLEGWVYDGIIDDPYQEFFIVENKHISKEVDAIYWEQRYRIHLTALPDFLQPVAEEILTTGKCLNAIRECGRRVQMPFPEGDRLTSASNEGIVLDRIHTAYQFACNELLVLIMQEFKLIARLHSVKHCFLLDQGDFIRDFMDTAKKELNKWKNAVSHEKLAPLLELALRTSSCSGDPFSEEITCMLDTESLASQVARIDLAGTPNRWGKETASQFGAAGTRSSDSEEAEKDAPGGASSEPQGSVEPSGETVQPALEDGKEVNSGGEGREEVDLWDEEGDGMDVEEGEEQAIPGTSGGTDAINGWETFTLDYKVSWPVSLVVSRRAIGSYQIIFRHLFHSLHTQRELCDTWQAHQVARPVNVVGTALRRSQFLCQRMLQLMENIMHFTTREVLEPSWHTLLAKLGNARSIDEVIEHHQAFLQRCVQQCQLLDKDFVQMLSKVKATCLEYALAAQWLMAKLATVSSSEALPTGPRRRSNGRLDSRVMELERQRRQEKKEHIIAQAARAADDAHFSQKLGKLESRFARDLAKLIKGLKIKTLTEPAVENLVRRLEPVGQGLDATEAAIASGTAT